jgi:hypothetical protein
MFAFDAASEVAELPKALSGAGAAHVAAAYAKLVTREFYQVSRLGIVRDRDAEFGRTQDTRHADLKVEVIKTVVCGETVIQMNLQSWTATDGTKHTSYNGKGEAAPGGTRVTPYADSSPGYGIGGDLLSIKAMNIVIEGGDSPVEGMIAKTDRGILVTWLCYIREVDPYEKIFMGMTRDGTFLVENGEVAGGMRNFQFNQGLIEMLSNVEALSDAARVPGEETFDMVVPAMKVREFNFTEVTRF